MKKWLTIMLILTPALVAAKQIYKWTDEDGVVHFSSKPVDETQTHDLVPLPTVPALNSGTTKKKAEAASRSVTKDTEFVSEEREPTQEEIDYCNKLNDNIRALMITPRVKIERDNGEYEVLDNEGRKKEIEQLKALKNDFC